MAHESNGIIRRMVEPVSLDAHPTSKGSFMTAFSAQVSQNQYLAQGADLVHAVMSVTSGSATAAAAAAAPVARAAARSKRWSRR